MRKHFFAPWVWIGVLSLVIVSPLFAGEEAGSFETASSLLGIPYRPDGALDEKGRYTTFADPEKVFEAPGLNCSGLVVALSRKVLKRDFPLQEASRDRKGDSGPVARLGQDWDFGFDVILNLSEGRPRRLLGPAGFRPFAQDPDGLNEVGFDFHDTTAWGGVLPHFKAGRLYLGSLSRAAEQPGYRRLHHHVVAILPDSEGHAWLYHATGRRGVHRLDLNKPEELATLLRQFPAPLAGPESLLLIEVALDAD